MPAPTGTSTTKRFTPRCDPAVTLPALVDTVNSAAAQMTLVYVCYALVLATNVRVG
jgi:hypothetical protein